MSSGVTVLTAYADDLSVARELHMAGQLDVAESAYRQLLSARPDDPEVQHYLGILLLQRDRYEEAVCCFKRSIQLDSSNPCVFNNLGIVLQKLGRTEEAAGSYKEAVELQPRFGGAWSNYGFTLSVLGRQEEALQAFNSALLLDASDAEIHFGCANVYYAMGCLEEAEKAYRSAVACNPGHAGAFCNLANVLADLGVIHEAEATYLQALSVAPLYSDVHNNLAKLYLESGRLNEAELYCRAALQLRPDFASALDTLGTILSRKGELSEAEASYRQAIQCDSSYAPAYANLGAVLNRTGRYAESEGSCRKAIALCPDSVEAYNNLGHALFETGRLPEAEDAFQEALSIDPFFGEGYANISDVLSRAGRTDEAREACLMALQVNPEAYESLVKLTMLSLPVVPCSQKETEHALQEFSAAITRLELIAEDGEQGALLGETIGTALPFNLAYLLPENSALYARYGTVVCDCRRKWFEKLYGGNVRPQPARRDRLRLVIISSHLRRHSVWDVLLHGLLRYIDKSLFEVVLYHTGLAQDNETATAMALADRFVQGPQDWLTMVLSDKPDIILYPEVGMDPVATSLAMLRLAPVQAACWGHPVTTGFPTIDYFITGELLERPAADNDYCEKLIRLPGTGACSVLMPYAPQALPSGLDFSEERSKTRFLVAQQASKFNPRFDELYPRIAIVSGPCHFWFVRDPKYSWASEIVEHRIRQAFVDYGLDPSGYVTFIDWMPGGYFWWLLDQMDVFLDTPAFSGYTTAWQALHRGVPVVTLEGEKLSQRLAAGLLRQLECCELIAGTVDEYIGIASALSHDPEKRERISRNVTASICSVDNNISVVRAVEQFLLHAVSVA